MYRDFSRTRVLLPLFPSASLVSLLWVDDAGRAHSALPDAASALPAVWLISLGCCPGNLFWCTRQRTTEVTRLPSCHTGSWNPGAPRIPCSTSGLFGPFQQSLNAACFESPKWGSLGVFTVIWMLCRPGLSGFVGMFTGLLLPWLPPSPGPSWTWFPLLFCCKVNDSKSSEAFYT